MQAAAVSLSSTARGGCGSCGGGSGDGGGGAWPLCRARKLATAAAVGADLGSASQPQPPALDSGAAGLHVGTPAAAAASGAAFGAAQLPGQAPWQRPYPYIDQRFPGLECVHEEPPVYVVRGFLTDEDCGALRAAAEAGQLPGLAYDNAVLLDTTRLWPLALVVAAGAGFDAWHAAAGAPPTLADLAAAAGPAAARWAAGVGALLGGALTAVTWLIGGKVFTGTKWTAAGLDAAHPAAPAFARFLAATSALLDMPPARLEPPTVTRYRRGEQQRIHFDARPDGDPAGLQQFLEAGGQRLVQVVAYLNSLSPADGGGTHFCHHLLAGLTVQPKRGDALVFFPASADGRFDERMAHAGLAVRSGEKWILNTWATQRPVPTAATHLVAPGQPAAARASSE